MDFLTLMRALMALNEKLDGKVFTSVQPGRLVLQIPISLEIEELWLQGQEMFAEVEV